MASFTLLDDFLSLIYPRLCVGCQKHNIKKGEYLCPSCHFEMPFTDHFNKADNGIVEHLYGRVPIVNGAAVVYFTPDGIVQKMVHRLKYKGDKDVGKSLGRYAGEKMQESSFFNDIDVIMPVPLHIRKRAQRGYNQAEQFGLGIAQSTGLPLIGDNMIKILETSSQTNKSRDERIANVKHSIAINKSSDILNKHILLVDDVVTTGATLEACGKILIENGAAKISVVCLALAV